MAIIRQNDLLPTFKALARTALGPVDLTVFKGITFRMVGPATITGSATGDALGNLEYIWQSGDTAICGNYLAVFVGTDSAGKTQTLPSVTDIPIQIFKAL